MFNQSGAPGCVMGRSDFSQQPKMVNIIFWFCHLSNFFICICRFDSIVSWDVELDGQAFDQL